MELLPVSLYEYLFLFLLCFVSFLIGWLAGRSKKRRSPVKNAPPEKDADLEITAFQKEIKAVQTRKRGGEAVNKNNALDMEPDDEETMEKSPEEAPASSEKEE